MVIVAYRFRRVNSLSSCLKFVHSDDDEFAVHVCSSAFGVCLWHSIRSLAQEILDASRMSSEMPQLSLCKDSWKLVSKTLNLFF